MKLFRALAFVLLPGFWFGFWIGFWSGFLPVPALAQPSPETAEDHSEGETTEPTASQSPTPEHAEEFPGSDTVAPKVEKVRPRRRIHREKKAEGTKARERFEEAATAIKSRYKYKGRTLNVDPD